MKSLEVDTLAPSAREAQGCLGPHKYADRIQVAAVYRRSLGSRRHRCDASTLTTLAPPPRRRSQTKQAARQRFGPRPAPAEPQPLRGSPRDLRRAARTYSSCRGQLLLLRIRGRRLRRDHDGAASTKKALQDRGGTRRGLGPPRVAQRQTAHDGPGAGEFVLRARVSIPVEEFRCPGPRRATFSFNRGTAKLRGSSATGAPTTLGVLNQSSEWRGNCYSRSSTPVLK